jgi:hypothetical protein
MQAPATTTWLPPEGVLRFEQLERPNPELALRHPQSVLELPQPGEHIRDQVYPVSAALPQNA